MGASCLLVPWGWCGHLVSMAACTGCGLVLAVPTQVVVGARQTRRAVLFSALGFIILIVIKHL